jgi:tetratricopeptide (TPR) repeat protein
VNVFLVFLLARRLLPGGLAAFLAAALFATHPMHSEVVAWTKNCAELLALMLALLSALSFTRVRGQGVAWRFALLAALLYAVALLCKESALPLPGLLVLWAFLWLGGRERWRGVWMTVPFWCLGVAYSVYQHAFLSMRPLLISTPERALGLGSRLLLGAETLANYFLMMVFPIQNRPLPEFWPYPRASAWQSALVLVGFAALGGMLLAHLWRRSRASFGVWWAALALGPVANLVKFNSARPIAEQRLYLPSVGFALFFAGMAASVQGRARRFAVGAVLAMVVVFAALSLNAGLRWGSALDFWCWTTRTAPGTFITHSNLGVTYAQAAEELSPRDAGRDESLAAIPPRGAGRERQAEASCLKAMWLNPYSPAIAFNLGNSFKRRGDYRAAAVFYRRCLQYAPDYARAHLNLGYSYLMLGDKEKAKDEMRLAAALDRECARPAHRYLAQLYYDLGQKDKALEEAETVLSMDERDRPVHLLAGRILAEKGRYVEAAGHFRRVQEVGGEDAGLSLLEGKTWRAAGNLPAAEAALRRAASLAPGRADVQLELGLVCLQLDKIAEAEKQLERLVAQGEGGADALVGLAGVRVRQERWDEAVPLYEKALQLSPDHLNALVTLGNILLSRKMDPKRGLELLEKARQLSPRDPRILSILVEGYVGADEREKARTLLRDPAVAALVAADAALRKKLEELLGPK